MEISVYRRIYALARIMGKDRLVSLATRLTDYEADKIANIASDKDAETLTKGEASVIIKDFNSGLDELLGLNGDMNRDEINSDLARRRKFSGEAFTSGQLKGFIKLSELEESVIKEIVDKESIYAKSVILSNIDAVKSEKVIGLYPMNERVDIFRTIGQSSGADIKLLESLSDSLLETIKDRSSNASISGTESVAMIAERMSEPELMSLLERLDKEDPELSEAIKNSIMTFNDILEFEQAVLDIIFDGVEPRKVALAVRDYEEDKKEIVIGSLTKEKGNIVRDEISMLANAPVSQVNDAKRDIVAVCKDLAQKGKIDLPKKS